MKESERNKLVMFLMEYKALGKYKECIEKYGTIKNFYAFCDNTPIELAFRSAFPWNLCEDEIINGMPGDKFWEHLNSQWASRLYKGGSDKTKVTGERSEKIRVMAQLFRMYQCPNSAKKFAGKICAKEEEVKQAIALAKSNVRLVESSIEELMPVEEQPPLVEVADDMPTVDYDWSNLTGVGTARRQNSNRGNYPDGMMFRVKRAGKNYKVLFSKYISDYLRERGCDRSMEMCQNKVTNQLVFVFGNGKPFQLSQYLSDGSMQVQNVAIVNMVESYVKTQFVENQNYFIPVLKMVHSQEMGQVAMIVTNMFKTEI